MDKEENKKEEVVDYVSKIIPSHDIKSREVKEEDIPRVVEDGKVLFNMCFTQYDKYSGAYAMAHPQITKDDPLRFFVLANKEIVINPVIVNKTKHPVDSVEGCITFYHLPPKIVQRSHKMQVSYITLNKEANGFTERRTVDLSGRDAFVFAHEIEHLDAKYIWEEEYNREKMIENLKGLKQEDIILEDKK